AAAMAAADKSGRPETNSAIETIQKARNGRSASSDPPFTTNGGTARKSSVAHSGRSENRRARDHIAQTASIENAIYAAWNGTSLTSPKSRINAARGHAFPGGCE